MQKLKIISLIGAPGSGKTTIGRFLEEHYKLPRFVMSDALRNAIASGSEHSDVIKHVMDNRLLVPKEVARPVIFGELSKFKTDSVVVMDGYPRNLEQLSVIESLDFDFLFFEIALDFKVCRERIENAKDRGNRIDDKDKVVYERGFTTFENETVPMMARIKEVTPERFFSVDGLLSAEGVSKEICRLAKVS